MQCDDNKSRSQTIGMIDEYSILLYCGAEEGMQRVNSGKDSRVCGILGRCHTHTGKCTHISSGDRQAEADSRRDMCVLYVCVWKDVWEFSQLHMGTEKDLTHTDTH